jgi:hypothetical protein
MDEPRQWVQAQTETNEGLLTFPSSVRGWRATGTTVYYPLNRHDLQNFLDCDAAMERVQTIATDDASEANRKLAAELLSAFAQGAGSMISRPDARRGDDIELRVKRGSCTRYGCA